MPLRLKYIRISHRFLLKECLSIFLFICVGCTLIYLLLQPNFESITVNIQRSSKRESKDSCFLGESEVDEMREKVSKNLKYMLLWTTQDVEPFRSFGEGQRAFIENNCPVINCYITTNKNFFNGDMSKFDVVAFNGRHMLSQDLPSVRFPHQKYAFFNLESSVNFPVCEPEFDGFFNWTSTYKLDSDIPYPYLIIKNRRGDIVGPKINMAWSEYFPKVDEALVARLRDKTAAVAWFSSNCNAVSGRDQLVDGLNRALRLFGLTVDVYGSCGMLQCPRFMEDGCDLMLDRDYFFYMALENSLAEDYVTEKVLRAFQHNTVPIVLGGANYSRFLPPGSYIDVRNYNMSELADTIFGLMKYPETYSNYFKWKKLYTYSNPIANKNICEMCTAMNNKNMLETETVYKEFRKWWNPNFERRCKAPPKIPIKIPSTL